MTNDIEHLFMYLMAIGKTFCGIWFLIKFLFFLPLYIFDKITWSDTYTANIFS